MWDGCVKFFVWQPGHIWTIAAVFGALAAATLAAKLRWPQVCCSPLALAALIWLGYGFWEREALAERANIRIDLLFGWPLLFGGTVLLVSISVVSVIVALICDKG